MALADDDIRDYEVRYDRLEAMLLDIRDRMARTEAELVSARRDWTVIHEDLVELHKSFAALRKRIEPS